MIERTIEEWRYNYVLMRPNKSRDFRKIFRVNNITGTKYFQPLKQVVEGWSTFVTISDVLCSYHFFYTRLLLLQGIFEYSVVCESATWQTPYWIFEVILCYGTFSATFVPEYDSSSISHLPNYLYTISLMPFFQDCRNFLFMEPFSLYHRFLYLSFFSLLHKFEFYRDWAVLVTVCGA